MPLENPSFPLIPIPILPRVMPLRRVPSAHRLGVLGLGEMSLTTKERARAASKESPSEVVPSLFEEHAGSGYPPHLGEVFAHIRYAGQEAGIRF